MAYFSIIRAAASMYRHIHSAYLETGVDLLRELSMAGPDDVRIARERALASYNQNLARELRNYIQEVKYPPPTEPRCA